MDVREMLKYILASMRPRQWYKNFIIFVGIVFSGKLFNIVLWPNVILVFIFFCALSGSIYIINDIRDINKDQLHPTKKYRPIASGNVSPKVALLASILLIISSLIISFLINRNVGYIGLTYLIMNCTYTYYLKNFAIIDVIVIAVGFVVRAIAGSVVIGVVVSSWLILCVFLMALVLAFGKRRHEIIIAKESRTCLSQYTEKMAENLLNISVAMLLMSYALYTFSVNIYMMATIPFAFFGVFRFLQLVYLNNFGSDAELILVDKASILNLILWMGSIIFLLYGGLLYEN